MNQKTARISLTPTTDIVLPCNEVVSETLFDRNTRKLIGVLHRRFWEKRRNMLRDRAVDGGVIQLQNRIADGRPPKMSTSLEVKGDGEVIADLLSTHDSWQDRLDEYLGLRTGMDSSGEAGSPPVVRIRGWEESEVGILVDGRSVAGGVVDVAVALSHGAHLFRQGTQAFVLEVPRFSDSTEEKLWADLLCLAQDRTGVERGTVLLGVPSIVKQTSPDVAVA